MRKILTTALLIATTATSSFAGKSSDLQYRSDSYDQPPSLAEIAEVIHIASDFEILCGAVGLFSGGCATELVGLMKDNPGYDDNNYAKWARVMGDDKASELYTTVHTDAIGFTTGLVVAGMLGQAIRDIKKKYGIKYTFSGSGKKQWVKITGFKRSTVGAPWQDREDWK